MGKNCNYFIFIQINVVFVSSLYETYTIHIKKIIIIPNLWLVQVMIETEDI